MPSLADREITVTFQLKSGGFGAEGADTVTLSGLRVNAQIDIAGNLSASQATVRIEGMTLTSMNQLSVAQLAGQLYQPNANTISIQAGDASQGGTLPTIFQGNIYEAFVDFEGSPQVAFNVTALSAGFVSIQPIVPVSYNGGASVATILASIAKAAGLQFQNNGVTAVLQNHYSAGTAYDQIAQVCQASRTAFNIFAGTLSIWPDGQGSTTNIPQISSQTGLIGYPAYNAAGVAFTTIFNPAITYYQTVQIASQYLPAAWTNQSGTLQPNAPSNGQWVVVKVTHELQSQMPDGPWFTHAIGATPAVASNITTVN